MYMLKHIYPKYIHCMVYIVHNIEIQGGNAFESTAIPNPVNAYFLGFV